MTRPEALVSSRERRLVGAGDQRRDVRRDARGRLEGPRRRAVAERRRLGGGGVRDDGPLLGRGDRELERGLEVGLLEHRVHTARVGHLELRVEVHLAVDGVDEAVQALARVRVHAVRVDHEFVIALETGQGDARVGVGRGRVDRAAVEGDLADVARDQVDEGVCALRARETDNGA